MPTAAILLADGFDTLEAIAPVEVLRRAGIRTRLVSATGSYQVISAQQVQLSADDMLDSFDFEKTEGLILPGGVNAMQTLHADERSRVLIRRFATSRVLAASGVAPCTLSYLGLLTNKKATVMRGYESEIPQGSFVDSDVVHDDGLLTCRSLSSLPEYSVELVTILAGEAAGKKAAQDVGLPVRNHFASNQG